MSNRLADARRFVDLASAWERLTCGFSAAKQKQTRIRFPTTQTKKRVAAGLRELGKYVRPEERDRNHRVPRPLHLVSHV